MALKEILTTFPTDIRDLIADLGGDIIAYRERHNGDEHGGYRICELTVRTPRLPPSRPREIRELRITADDVVEVDLYFTYRRPQ